MAGRSSQAIDWATLCCEWRGSGLTQPEFCRRRGIPLHTFRRRLYQPDARDVGGDVARPTTAPPPEADPPTRTPSPCFIPVRVVADDRPAPGSATFSTLGRPVEVILAGGHRIAVPPGFDAETLLRVVHLLESPGC
jgi:hypothetical protein